jgi:hypothetical protein
MELTAITPSQVLKHKDDSGICGEVIGWSTSDYGLTQKITIRKCVNEEFIEETFDAKDLTPESDSKKSEDYKKLEQWLTIFYALDPKDGNKEIIKPEEVMSHTKLMHVNKAKSKDVNEILIRDLLTSNMMPHLRDIQDVKLIRVWDADKSYVGDFSIERVINITKLKIN